jgi:hypothetical protein
LAPSRAFPFTPPGIKEAPARLGSLEGQYASINLRPKMTRYSPGPHSILTPKVDGLFKISARIDRRREIPVLKNIEQFSYIAVHHSVCIKPNSSFKRR